MYINIKLFEKSGLKNSDLVLLCAIKTVETKFLVENLTEQDYNRFKTLNLIKHVKTKKKNEHLYESLRIDKKGMELLDNLSTPEVLEEHIRMRDYLVQMYLAHEDTERVVGNKKLVGTYIAILQNHLAIDIYKFYYLCEFFLSEHVYTRKLENIFMDRNKIRYGDFKNNIGDSTLYQFYEQRREDVERYWEQKIKINK